jgi:hypothetical protein
MRGGTCEGRQRLEFSNRPSHFGAGAGSSFGGGGLAAPLAFALMVLGGGLLVGGLVLRSRRTPGKHMA